MLSHTNTCVHGSLILNSTTDVNVITFSNNLLKCLHTVIQKDSANPSTTMYYLLLNLRSPRDYVVRSSFVRSFAPVVCVR